MFDGGLPYEENNWKEIQIQNSNSNFILNAFGPCTRCNVIGVNQSNSEKVQEPLQTLAKSEVRRFKFGLLAGTYTIQKDDFFLKENFIFTKLYSRFQELYGGT